VKVATSLKEGGEIQKKEVGKSAWNFLIRHKKIKTRKKKKGLCVWKRAQKITERG